MNRWGTCEQINRLKREILKWKNFTIFLDGRHFELARQTTCVNNAEILSDAPPVLSVDQWRLMVLKCYVLTICHLIKRVDPPPSPRVLFNSLVKGDFLVKRLENSIRCNIVYKK